MNSIKKFRVAKDEFFRYDPHSPLADDQKEYFNGLGYFPENRRLNFVIDIDEFDVKEEIQIQTSTGDYQIFQRFGIINFEVDGQSARLTVYSNQNGFFLPFIDSLAGTETYPAGRYLDPEILSNGKLVVDFNLAYNPYCAYNDYWSCPLPPAENRLNVPIRAGEKIYKQISDRTEQR
jgi:uncharacterized protein (DUF1684 family)